MRELAPHPLEALLRLCEASAPRPWFPRVDPRPGGMSQDELNARLQQLWLDNLIEKAPGTPETGPGLVLTAAGRRTLDDPEALQRLREGREAPVRDSAALVRKALSQPMRPYATVALLGLNVAAFFLQGTYEDWWTLSGRNLLRGEWWRIATCCFVHFGPMHLLMNMFALFQLGQINERWWGRARFLTIYAFAGLGGSCLAVAMEPGPILGGASGAICGLFGALAVFILCNRKHLPRDFIRSWQTNLIINGVMLVAISFMPHVSYWCHLGGAVTGAAVALVMQVQRFGSAPWRWVVLAALLPLPWLGYALIEHQRATDKNWPKLRQGQPDPDDKPKDGQRDGDKPKDEPADERDEWTRRFDSRFVDVMNAAGDVFNKEALPLLKVAAADRDKAKVETVKRRLLDQENNLQTLVEDLAKARPLKDPQDELVRQAAQEFADGQAGLLRQGGKRLSVGEKWTLDDKDKAEEVRDLERAWLKARQ